LVDVVTSILKHLVIGLNQC